MIARAARGDESSGGVAWKETGKGVSCNVRGDGRVGCDRAATLPAVGVSFEALAFGAVPSRRTGLVDVKRHVVLVCVQFL